MTKPKILIVEDEANIRRFVRIALEQEGMAVAEVASAAQARMDAATRKPDLMIVDLGLPDGDGKELILELRSWVHSPILVLSAREREEEKVAALNAGADDYLVKPFGVPELLARIRALLRRSQLVSSAQAASSRIRFGAVSVDLSTHEVTRAGQPVHLTPIEFRLLSALIRGHGKVLTHQHLLHETWGASYGDRPHYLRVYMMQLRQKLEDDASQPKHLLTELQVGYRLTGALVDAAPEAHAAPGA
ncbi:response regulator [Alcaligenes sp. SDU_A2]|uniref:response regulator n=1 Tax=Alcaligenes sp. SDU_A2 TaxID=3136634 RepID=UPI002BA4C3B6|nr:response regulator [Alcaligenes sp.]HRL27993.1 response regulator [Alcaligenes sp.]